MLDGCTRRAIAGDTPSAIWDSGKVARRHETRPGPARHPRVAAFDAPLSARKALLISG
jgi:hypothetical protein